jgi:hypothetical protein
MGWTDEPGTRDANLDFIFMITLILFCNGEERNETLI